MTTVFVDAENVRRSTWPNLLPERLVELCRSYWLVTSDRALRDASGADAERAIGGGAFLRLLGG